MDGGAKVEYNNMVIAIVQDGKIEYTKNAENPEAKKMLDELNKELTEKKQKDEPETELGEKEPEQEETIKDKLENDKDDEKLKEEEPEKKENNDIKRDSSWIEIRSDREVDEMKTFIGTIKKEHPELGNIRRTFVAPDKKNGNSYKLYAQTEKGTIKEVPLKQTEGVNPMQENVTTLENDGTNAEKKKPIQMLKINNRNILMIYNGGRTTTSIHIGKRTDGDNYTSTEISSADSQNKLLDSTESVKKQVSSTRGSQVEGDRAEQAFATIKNFEKQNVPDKINPEKDGKGIEADEMDRYPQALKEGLAYTIKNAAEDKGIVISKKSAEIIANGILEGKDYRQACKDGMKNENNFPGSEEKAGEELYEDVFEDKKQDKDKEDEQELDPRAPRR